MQLTLSGISFLELSEKWCDFFYEIDDIKKNGAKISLSIVSLTSINIAVFPKLYQNLITRVPKIDLSIITSHSLDMFNLIEKKHIDIGLSFISISSQNVQVYKLYAEPIIGISFKDSLLAGKSSIGARDLNLENELYVRWDNQFQDWHNKFFDNNHTLGTKLDNAELILNLFSNEKQWAIVPLSVAIFAKNKLNFATFELNNNNYQRDTYLIMHKTPKQSARFDINIFLSQLKNLDKFVEPEFSKNAVFLHKIYLRHYSFG